MRDANGELSQYTDATRTAARLFEPAPSRVREDHNATEIADCSHYWLHRFRTSGLFNRGTATWPIYQTRELWGGRKLLAGPPMLGSDFPA
jgi:hypothetical protein